MNSVCVGPGLSEAERPTCYGAAAISGVGLREFRELAGPEKDPLLVRVLK